MRLSDAIPGIEVVADEGFTCIRPGRHLVEADEHGVFIRCADGRHYLDGQEGRGGHLVGLTLANEARS